MIISGGEENDQGVGEKRMIRGWGEENDQGGGEKRMIRGWGRREGSDRKNKFSVKSPHKDHKD